MIPPTLEFLRRAANRRFARFLCVGALNTAFGYGVFAALILIGASSGPALAASTTAGVLFNYLTTGRLVFGRRGLGRLPAFVGVYALIWLVNVAALRSLEGWDMSPLAAQALLTPPMVVFSYLLNKLIVFNSGSEAAS